MAMSRWEYNMVCCGTYAKADMACPRLCVIGGVQNRQTSELSPGDFVTAMSEKGWQLVCQTPAFTPSSAVVPYQIFFSFRRQIES